MLRNISSAADMMTDGFRTRLASYSQYIIGQRLAENHAFFFHAKTTARCCFGWLYFCTNWIFKRRTLVYIAVYEAC